jgi:hypothetical protein
MQLPLLVKFGKIWHHQRRRANPWWAAEQGSLQPVFTPILAQRPCKLRLLLLAADSRGRFRGRSNNYGRSAAAPDPLQISISELLWSCARTISWLASDPPFLGEATRHCVVQRRWPCGNLIRRSRTRFRDRPKTVRLHPGFGVHLHPGSLFGIIPDWRSASSRNRVHVPPDSPDRNYLPIFGYSWAGTGVFKPGVFKQRSSDAYSSANRSHECACYLIKANDMDAPEAGESWQCRRQSPRSCLI